MTLYVFDTDHLSLYGRNLPALVNRLSQRNITLVTTVVNVEEQLRGRLAQVAQSRDETMRSVAYQWLSETRQLLSVFQVLPYDDRAQVLFRDLKAQKIRVGSQDLWIGSIALAHGGVLLTRNQRDFEQIPGLRIENWSI